MSDRFEDELRATMRAHDAEAPAALDPAAFAGSPRRRTARWLPAAAAALVVLATGGLVLALRPAGDGGPAHRPAAADCPATYFTRSVQPWVPEFPTTSEPAARLVPRATPTSAVVCAYLGDAGGRRQALTGTRRLYGALSGITASLTEQPAGRGADVCPDYLATTDHFNYLLRLRFGRQQMWVSTPGNHCAGAGNGRFRGANNLAAYSAAAYDTGRWTTRPAALGRLDPVTDNACSADGRLGQDRQLVPDRPTALMICTNSNAGILHRRITDISTIRAFAGALNSLPTRASNGLSTGGGNTSTYQLVFTYASGPGVEVNVFPGAHPPIDNRSLQATELGPVLDLIRRATR